MWYVVPTPPHVVNGTEKGSMRNRKYAIRGDEELEAYLKFTADGQNLRSNYIDVMTALRDCLERGVMPFHPIDLPKLHSSVRMFDKFSRERGDTELAVLLGQIIRLLKSRRFANCGGA